jgi:iron complex outermembrane receptor protein
MPTMRIARIARALLLTSTMLVPVAAIAQAPVADPQAADAPPPAVQASEAADAPQPGDADTTGDVVVTGTRIQRPDYEAPNPIVSFNATNIQQSGNTNITNFLQRVPALTGSRDRTQTSGGNGTYGSFGQTGLNQLNLRNLGTNRTLVLVDGRRHVAGEANTAAVDINAIPTDLISRVDVLTGAVSAVYGADGVSGVVNFIMKRDFDGLTARAQSGISDYGDAGNRFVSVTAGRNFADGRANVTLNYEYNADDPVTNDDRPFLRQANRKFLIPNDADVGDNPNVPDNILVGDLHYTDISPIGAVFVGGESNPSYDGFGRPYDRGTPAAYYFTGGVSTPVAGFYQGDILPKVERHAVNLLTHFDASDAFKVSLEGKFVQNTTSSFGQYPQTYYVPVSLANPFVPAAIRDAAVAAGAANLFVNRDNIDFGRQGEEDRRRTYRGVVDFSGRISDHASWDLYYEYGRTDVRIRKINDRLSAQYLNAIDAVVGANGQIVCNPANNPGAGCIPISLFGTSTYTPEQLDYFLVSHDSAARITQQVVSGSVSGDFGAFFELPGGPIRFAFGGEYRKETSRFSPNADLVNARFFQYDEPSVVTPSRGSFDVKEAFGELEATIFKDQPFASLLSVGAAGRYSDYSTVGGNETWQFNGTYAPIADISFRGSYGKAVRAPNIGELFQPRLGDAAFFTDPCTPQEINNGTQYRQANCTATLAAVGAVSSAALQNPDFIRGTSSGNPNLQPERATTWTAGVLLRPSFLRGFNASADWYDITLNGAINTVAAGTLAALCVDQPTVPNQFCNSFTRAQGTGIVNNYQVGPLNVAQFRTAGLDINIDYLFETARAGTFDLRLVAGYLDKLTLIGIPGAPAENQVDQAFKPRWNANFSPTWTLGGLSVNYNLRFQNATLAFSRNALAANPDIAAGRYIRNDALWQHDAQVKYRVNDRFEGYLGVNNLTDQKPDPASYGTNVPIPPLGRFYYAGVRVALDRR